MQGLSLSSLWCNDITIANTHYSRRDLSKVNKTPQNKHACVATRAPVLGRFAFKERAFYFCGVLTDLSFLHTRSYWINIYLQSKDDFEKSRFLFYISQRVKLKQIKKTLFRDRSLHIAWGKGDGGIRGFYLYNNIFLNSPLSFPPHIGHVTFLLPPPLQLIGGQFSIVLP